MRDQEGTDLGWACFPVQHHVECIRSLFAGHALAGVLSAADLAQMLLEALATAGQRAGHRLHQELMQCSGAHDL